MDFGKWGQKTLNGVNKGRKKSVKKNISPLHFCTILEQKSSNLRPLFSTTFAPGLRISKSFGHPTSGSGGKKTLNGSSKVNRQTHGHTDGYTDGHFDLGFKSMMGVFSIPDDYIASSGMKVANVTTVKSTLVCLKVAELSSLFVK